MRERRQAVSVRQLRVGAGSDQQLRRRDVVHAHGPVQCGRAVGPWSVRVNLLRDQRANRGHVAPHRRIGEARIVVRSLARSRCRNEQQNSEARSRARHTSPTHGHFTHTTPLDNPFGPDFSKFLASGTVRTAAHLQRHETCFFRQKSLLPRGPT